MNQAHAAAHPQRILVVDDEPTLRTVISHVLVQQGHDVTTAGSAEEALALFRNEPFPLVLSDIVMGGMTGLDLLKELKKLDPGVHVVIMTSNASVDSATTALRSGAYDYLTKPFDDIDVIWGVVNRAAENIRLIEENARLVATLKQHASELERLNRTLQDMASRDGLTGLYNHRYFREALFSALDHSSSRDAGFGLVLADIDHFKLFNDTHGHLAGDEVLKMVSGILRSQAPGGAVLARYGGEEFVFLLPGFSKEAARDFAERVRTVVADTPLRALDADTKVRLTLSLGVAAYPADGTDANALIARADKALYEAKKSGRNLVCV